MGMSGISTHVIMFIAVLSISTVVVGVFNEQVDATTSSVVSHQQMLSKQLKTDITIEIIDFVDTTENQTTIYIENTGQTILDPDLIDVYIGGERIARNNASRTIEVLSDTEITNIGLFDPKEELRIVVNKTLPLATTYEVVVFTQYNGKDSDEFST